MKHQTLKHLGTICIIIAAVSLVGVPVVGAQQQAAPAEELTEKVRVFLKKEMRLLADGGRAIEVALAKRDSATVAEEAAKIHETFVHKEEVTTFDLRVLQAVLGEDFVQQDKDFHAQAQALEVAAKAEDTARQQKLFDQMLKACAACHQAYAPEAPLLEQPD